MSIAFVNRAAPSGATSGSVSSLSTVAAVHTTGNLVVCSIHRQTPTTVTQVFDTAANTYIKLVDSFAPAGDTDRIDIWYAYNITGHAANVVAVTLGSGSVYALVMCRQFSGVGSAAPFGTSSTGSGNSTSVSSGVVATTGSDSLIYAALKNGGASWTAGSGYTLNAEAVSGDGSTYFADEYHLVSASEAATATLGSSDLWGAAAVSFNSTAVAVITPPPRLFPRQAVNRASNY